MKGGEGVAVVTKNGLGLEVGTHAINPVPRKHISTIVKNEIESFQMGAIVTISVPRGQEMAKKTINERLGLIGGISILGTSGIVRPYSTAAFRTSVIQAIDVSTTKNHKKLVLTTGGKSEQYAMNLFRELPEEVFIQVGDFIGVGIKHCQRCKIENAVIVGMVGKLSKMANGVTQTHQAGSSVDFSMLSDLALQANASSSVASEIQNANTARESLEICQRNQVHLFPDLICEKVCTSMSKHNKEESLQISCFLVDFDGKLLGRHPR